MCKEWVHVIRSKHGTARLELELGHGGFAALVLTKQGLGIVKWQLDNIVYLYFGHLGGNVTSDGLY
jgi:hypothetical protein